MKLLLPLGLLGLLGIIALIIIYIIKPNYQQKLISSSLIWRLSLKYRKKKIPFSRLRNIILIICQVLIIVSAAFILSKPVKVLKEQMDEPEVILIVDASASMRAGDNTTRFERAVNEAIKKANSVFDKNGFVSVILSQDSPIYLVERAGPDSRNATIEKMNELLDEETMCSYGISDMKAAVAKTDQVLQINPTAKIYLYTDTVYDYIPDNVGYESYDKIVNKEEWNAAILNATAIFEDNYYTFYVDVACYNRDIDLEVKLEIFGANAEDSLDVTAGTVTLVETVPCSGDETVTLIFKYFPDEDNDAFEATLPENNFLFTLNEDNRVFSYQSVHISIDQEDSLTLDNSYEIYGGLKPLLKIQYYSQGIDPGTGEAVGSNIFFQEMLSTLRKNYANLWDIQIKEVKKGDPYETDGYDFYIFEHTMPSIMPTDGAMLLVDPMNIPESFGVRYAGVVDLNKKSVYLAADESHPILENITPSNISVSRYVKFSYVDPDYKKLLSYAGEPMLLVKNEGVDRIAIMSFSLHYSNLAVLIDFPMLITHIFDYFLPSTVSGNSFETYQQITLNCQGETLNLKGYDVDRKFTEFPASVALEVPGSYTLTQTTFAGRDMSETIYIKMPNAESNIFATDDTVSPPNYEVDPTDYYDDLLFYLAVALVALLTIEWYLQHKESSI